MRAEGYCASHPQTFPARTAALVSTPALIPFGASSITAHSTTCLGSVFN